MLKKNVSELKKNVFTEIGSNWALLTAGDKSTGFNTMTVSWGGLGVLWGKNVGFVFVRKSRHTYNFIEKSDNVTLSFLPEKYKSELGFMGSKSGRDYDKFKETGLHPTYDFDYMGWYVAESDYVLKMKKIYSIDIPYDKLPQNIIDRYYPTGDMHTMYVCEIVGYLEKE